MCKLLKYEFRKSMTALLVMLGVTAALEGYFLYGVYVNPEDMWHAALAASLLLGMTVAMSVFVFVRGVTSYASELKSRSAYLIFMTPHSTLKIVASKFLFTFVLGLLAAAVYGALGLLDITLLLAEFGELEETLTAIHAAMTELGLHLDQAVLAVVLAFLMVMLYVLSLCAMAYLAVTLSHTLFRDKSWRWLAALGFYWALTQLLGLVNGLFASPFEALVFQTAPGMNRVAAAYNIPLTPGISDLLPLLVPYSLVSLGMILASLFGCAWMLDKKVSL
jgi:hypothetical protein